MCFLADMLYKIEGVQQVHNCLAVVSLELSTWILKSPTINSRLCRWSAVIDSKSLENSSKNNDVDKPGSRSTSRIFIQRTMPRWTSKRVILIRERGVYANAALKYNSNSTTSRMRSWYMHHSISFRTYCTNFHRVDSTRTKPCFSHREYIDIIVNNKVFRFTAMALFLTDLALRDKHVDSLMWNTKAAINTVFVLQWSG